MSRAAEAATHEGSSLDATRVPRRASFWLARLGSLPAATAQEPTQAGPTEDSALLLVGFWPRVNQGAVQALMIPLRVRDGMVDRPEKWPGAKFLPKDLGTTVTISKPEGAFFGGRGREHHPPADEFAIQDWKVHLANEERLALEAGRARDRERALRGKGVSEKRRRALLRQRRNRLRRQREERLKASRSRSTLPDEVKIEIACPPGYEDWEIEDVRAHFQGLLEEELRVVHATRLSEGKNRYMGVEAVLAQDPRGSAGSVWPTFGRIPRIACKGDPAMRYAILEELVSWRIRYRLALESRRQALASQDGTENEIEFPLGTYKLLRDHHVRIRGVTRAPPRLAA